MALLVRSDHQTTCPYKGRASYFTLQAGDRIAENAVWSYDQPLADVAEIAGCVAFYRNKVDSIDGVPG